MDFVSHLLIVFSGMLAIPAFVFVSEIAAAVLLGRSKQKRAVDLFAKRPRVAVLVPAHDESEGIAYTVRTIAKQLQTKDRLLVVADNCSDDTAVKASSAGAEVVERHDLNRIGKGYALQYGIEHLRSDPPEILIMIDADCTINHKGIEVLAMMSGSLQRPIQALDLMVSPVGSPINYQVAEFAWRVKNWARPLGLHLLGLPCQLMGTGMAFPWPMIQSEKIASAHLAEDLHFGLNMAMKGNFPLFCVDAVVTSNFPSSIAGATHQRQRWEHGHLDVITKTLPRLFFLAVASCNWRLLAVILDAAVPPLTLLVTVLAATFLISGAFFLFGYTSIPFIVNCVSLFAVAIAIALAWLNFGRDILPARSTKLIAAYAFKKFKLYAIFFTKGPIAHWTRADRNKETH